MVKMNLVLIFVFLMVLLNISKCSAQESNSTDDMIVPCLRGNIPSDPNRWRNGTVHYAISSEFSRKARFLIENTIRDWNSKIPEVQFVPLPSREYNRDHVRFIDGIGCYSYLGRKGGQQVLSIQEKGCLNPTTIQHEMMHAVGFDHEQKRPDRDQFLKILWKNIDGAWKSQYHKIKDASSPTGFGRYNYYSIMHYPLSLHNRPAMEVLKDGVDLEKVGKRAANLYLTSLDIWKIRKYYQEL